MGYEGYENQNISAESPATTRPDILTPAQNVRLKPAPAHLLGLLAALPPKL